MFDPRILKLADGLVNFSCAVKPGENVLIQSIGGNEDLTRALIKAVYQAGGVPFLWLEDKNLDREIMLGGRKRFLDRGDFLGGHRLHLGVGEHFGQRREFIAQPHDLADDGQAG